MNVVRQNRLTQQNNPEVPGLMHKLIVKPQLAMVVILPRDRILPQQKTPPRRPIHHMHRGNLVRRKHFNPRQSCHFSTLPPVPKSHKSTLAQSKILLRHHFVSRIDLCPQ